MQVLTQQKIDVETSQGLISSNFIKEEKESSIDRLRRGMREKSTKVSVYFECPPIKVLTAEEKREIVNKTFQLGNILFHDFSKDNESTNFVHSYSLRYIELDESAINAIDAFEHKCVY
jgi:hypothetical protein